MTPTILIIFLLGVVFSFNLKQTIQLNGRATTIESTSNGSHVCIVNLLAVDIYQNMNGRYVLQQKMTFISSAVHC